MKSLVPVPKPDNTYRYLLACFSTNKKCVENLAFSMLEEALFSRKLASHFLILYFLLYFNLDPDPNPVPGSDLEPAPEP